MSTVKLHPKALKALRTLALANAITAEVYLDALLNYAWSQHQRPGSWEANSTFDFGAYDTRPVEGDPTSLRGCADRWWPEGE